MPGQFSLHSAVSVSRRHGAGVKKAPATAPPANLKISLRFLICTGSFMTIQATVLQVRLAVAGDTGVHGHGRPSGMSPNIARIATDAVLLVGRQRVACPLGAVALFAFQVAAFDVRDVREVDILGLTRVDQPLRLAARRHITINEVLFSHGGAHGGGMAAGAFIQGGNAGESAVGAKRVAVVALGSGLIGVDLVAEIDGLPVRLVDDARKSGPARCQGGQDSGGEYDGSAKFHGVALSACEVRLA